MKIEIEIQDIRLLVKLSRWASVSRTFGAIKTALEDPDDEEAFEIAMSEIDEIGPALDALHKLVQSQLWINMCGQLIRPMHGYSNDIVCRREKDHLGRCVG